MKIAFLVIICLVLAGGLITPAQAKDFMGIVPLKSTRTEVEQKFGKADDTGDYQLKGKRFHVFYLEESCQNTEVCECLVERDTVLEIRVYIRKELKLDRLKLNLQAYEKTESPHMLDRVTYSNSDEGIVYEVLKEDNTVIAMSFLPSKKDCLELLENRKGLKTGK